jgi:hypothetical protein
MHSREAFDPVILKPAGVTAAFVAATDAASALSRLVRFGGNVKDLNSTPETGVVGITFALPRKPAELPYGWRRRT